MRHYVLDDDAKMSSYFKAISNPGLILWTTDNTALSLITSPNPDVKFYVLAVASTYADSPDKQEEREEFFQALDNELP